MSGARLMSNVCATCSDGMKNGAETDVDCGGGACPACACGVGRACGNNMGCNGCSCAGNPKTCG
jgi:hypothetical protein